MTPEQWQRIDHLFQATIALAPEERSAFLDQACGDDRDLRREVEALIASDEHGLSFIENPAIEMAASLVVSEEPKLPDGHRLGQYEIAGLLGRGGMGEVYLAQDTELGRRIAIKLLPVGVTDDKDRLQRFRHEARVASALNHPNILTIHQIGQVDGRYFIATEFIDGETLRQRMRGSRLSLNEVVDIGSQVASALAAAHEAGIVHRDIKPENIMLRRDGYVKVLDFGLAKLSEQHETPIQAGAGEILSVSSSLIAGTVKYMSPEQARGERVDARSDIFSLGVVLYEMITGRTPFDGKTENDLVAAIVKNEVSPPLTDYLPDTPAELHSIVSKALVKNRDERYQSAKVMLSDLKDLRRRVEVQSELGRAAADSSSASVSGLASLLTLTRSSMFPRKIGGHWSQSAFIVVVLALAATILFGLFKIMVPTKGATAFQNIAINKVTSNGASRNAAISPDGKYVAYVEEAPAQQTIWIKQVATDNSVQVVPPSVERLAALTFSRDSNFLYYVQYYIQSGVRSDRNALYEVSVFGGPARRIIEEVDSPISFSPDGKRFAFFRNYPTRHALLIAGTDGTGEREIISRSDPDHLWDYPCGPAWSPDGRVIVCASGRDEGNYNTSALIEVNARDGSERIISAGRNWSYFGLSWIPDGTGLLVTALKGMRPPETSQLWHVSYPSGEVLRMTNDLDDYVGVSVTADSTVITSTQESWSETMWALSGSDPTQARLVNSSRTLYYGIAWAPDGRIVYSQLSKGGSDIWIMNQDGSHKQQLTFNSEVNGYPSVSPGGKYIIFLSNRSDSSGIWRMDIDGGNQTQLTKVNGLPEPLCTPDGRWVIFWDTRWWRVPMDGGEPIQLPIENIEMPGISPDGRFIAYPYLDTEVDPPSGIAIIPFGGGEVIKRFPIPKTLRTSEFELIETPRVSWSTDGQALIYNGSNLWSQPIDGSPATQITNFQGDHILWYDRSPDGKKFACIRVAERMDTVLISNK